MNKLVSHLRYLYQTSVPTFKTEFAIPDHFLTWMSIVLTLNGAYVLLSFIIWPYFYILANLSSYSNYIFGTMDPDRTGVVTFEVSKLDNFWWKVEIFELFLNVKHNSFFQLTGKLASKWQRSRKPHSCHIRTKGSLGEVLLSGTGFQFVLSLDFIWFYYSVFILFQDFAAGLAVLQRGRWIYVQFKMERFALMNVAGKIWKWTCEHFCRLSKTKISTWNGLRSWMLQKNMEIKFFRVIKKIDTAYIKRKARMLQW